MAEQRARSALLVLADGTVFEGEAFGAPGTTLGEVVFNTSMMGYQEILTDPSYAGQLVTLTYPLIGNYGVNDLDSEADRIMVSGFIVREWCETPSHWRANGTVDDFLRRFGVAGISGIDTRALTRHLRDVGVMMGAITTELDVAATLARIQAAPRYDDRNFVAEISARAPYQANAASLGVPLRVPADEPRRHIVVVDLGVKRNILRELAQRGCELTVVPYHTSARDVLDLRPDGVLLSPGPGDPALLVPQRDLAAGLIGRVPVMGICLGHQLLATALGARTFKLKFGHRGGNHPVRDEDTGRVHITSQNHGYAVDGDRLGAGARVTHINLNDGTVEGFRHTEYPLLSIQYHSEAAPGPQDNKYLFDEFLALVDQFQGAPVR